jgi:hypothetical protein
LPWYFSGNLLQVELAVSNTSHRDQDVGFRWELTRQSGTDHREADFIKQGEGFWQLNPRARKKALLRAAYLPRPGHYSMKVELHVIGEGKEEKISGEVLNFSALRGEDAAVTSRQ